MNKIEIEEAKLRKAFQEGGSELKEGLVELFGEELFKSKVFDPESVEWVDLGLPSGRLWAKENAEGLYTYDEAVGAFGRYLPKGAAMDELIEECQVEWNSRKKGLDVTGPNGNSIFLPAAGYRGQDGDLCNVGEEGDYWTSMPYAHYKSPDPFLQAYARSLYFFCGGVNPLSTYLRVNGFSVRPSRELTIRVI